MSLSTQDEAGSIKRSTAMISRSALQRCLILALLLSFHSGCNAAWMPPTSVSTALSKTAPTPLPCSSALSSRSRHHRADKQLYSNQSNDSDEKKEETNKEPFDLDAFLDKPFFEPDKVLKDENSNPLLKKFAAFVLGDYEFAEALLTGIFFVVLIIITQEALRMQINGANYVPFTKGTIPGSLF
jgi:hypothetical protein